MPRRRVNAKRRWKIHIHPEVLEFLNGKPMEECGEEAIALKYFGWSQYVGGIPGLVRYAQENGLMPKKTPPEVQELVDFELDRMKTRGEI